MTTDPSTSSWLSWIVDYVSPASWYNWFIGPAPELIDLENISKEYQLTFGASLICQLPINQSFQHQLKQLCVTNQSTNQLTNTRIEIDVTVLTGSLSSVTMSAESPSNPEPLMKIDQPINQSESITLMLDRVNTNQFQPRSWYISIINSYNQSTIRLTGRVVSSININENGKKTSTTKLQSAKLLGYGPINQSTNQSTETTTTTAPREDHAYHAMQEPTPTSKV